jgi:hypothetical protein
MEVLGSSQQELSAAARKEVRVDQRELDRRRPVAEPAYSDARRIDPPGGDAFAKPVSSDLRTRRRSPKSFVCMRISSSKSLALPAPKNLGRCTLRTANPPRRQGMDRILVSCAARRKPRL